MRQCRLSLGTFALIAAPFYLNDLANLWVSDWRGWLAIDYLGVKLLPLVLIYRAVRRGEITPGGLGLRAQSPGGFGLTFTGVAVAGILIDQNAYVLLEGLPGYPPLGGMPPITSPAWNWFDLTAGLLAVGAMEELVFRGAAAAWLGRHLSSPMAVVAVSALLFGLIHWSGGAHAVLVTGLIGAMLMSVYLVTRALPALMLAHVAINFVNFAGVVPKTLFRLT